MRSLLTAAIVLLATAVVLLALGLAACTEGESTEAPEPTSEPPDAPAPIAEVVASEPEPTTEPAPVVVATEPPIAATATPPEPDLPALPDPVETLEAEPTSLPITLPTADFPADISLLAEHYHVVPKDGPVADDVERIYWRNGRLVRETIIPAFGPVSDGGYNMHLAFHPDGSSIVMTVCVEDFCNNYHDLFNDEPPGYTALYESQDGGITWEKLTTFDLPWVATRFLPAGEGETHLLLQAYRGFFKDIDGHYTKRPAKMVWSSSGGIADLPGPLPDLNGGVKGEEECLWCLKLPDGLLLLIQDYRAEELIGPYGAAEGRVVFYDVIPWPTIQDPALGEQWPIWMPPDVLRAEEGLWPLAVQHGPFLRVTDDVDGCLPVVADPSPDAEELACAAPRVLLTDLGEAEEIEGAIWHRVQTPAGIVGWGDGRSLE